MNPNSLLPLCIGMLLLSGCEAARQQRLNQQLVGMLRAGYETLPGNYTTGPNMTGVNIVLSKDGSYEAIGWGCIGDWGNEKGNWIPDERGLALEPSQIDHVGRFVASGYDVQKRGAKTYLFPRPEKPGAPPQTYWRNRAVYRVEK